MPTDLTQNTTIGDAELSDVFARARAEGLARLAARNARTPRYTPEQLALIASDARFDIGEIASEALAGR
jgi:hypothetical protein